MKSAIEQRETTYLEHRGYLGSVEVDVASNTLHGTVQGINDVIHYEADSPAALLEAFRGSVDDYLAWCEEAGHPPQKPYSGKFNVRLGQDLHRRAAATAAVRRVSLNDLVREAVERVIDLKIYPRR